MNICDVRAPPQDLEQKSAIFGYDEDGSARQAEMGGFCFGRVVRPQQSRAWRCPAVRMRVNIRHKRTRPRQSTDPDFSWNWRLRSLCFAPPNSWHDRCVPRGIDEGFTTMIATLYNPLFWDKKLRIALLTLATFAALC